MLRAEIDIDTRADQKRAIEATLGIYLCFEGKHGGTAVRIAVPEALVEADRRSRSRMVRTHWLRLCPNL